MSWHAHGTIPGLDIELAIRFDGVNWDDVTLDLRSAVTNISRSRALSVFPPGTASFNLDNRGGDYAPLNSSGAYYGEVLPGRHIRLKARYSGVTYNVWYGIVRSWGDSYPQAKDGIATVEAVQPSALLAVWRGAPSYSSDGTPVTYGADELSSARVSRILTAASWPLSSTVATGVVHLAASALTDDGLSLIERVVQTELGAFWCDPDGSAQFENRYALINNSRSNTSQVTFGNGGGAEVPYLVEPGPELSSGLDLVINQATRADDGGLASIATDSASVTSLGMTSADSDTGLIGSSVYSSYAEATAAGVVYQYADPYQHPTRITLRPAGAAALSWPQALGRRIRDKVTVKVPAPWGTMTSPVWLVGVSHQLTPGDWVTSFEFEPADALASTGFGVVGTAVVDTTKVAF